MSYSLPMFHPCVPPLYRFFIRCSLHPFNSTKLCLQSVLPPLRICTPTVFPLMASSADAEPSKHPPKLENGGNACTDPENKEEEDYEAETMDHFEVEESLPGIFCADMDARHLLSPEAEVMRLEDLTDQWRRSRIAWLCKELPACKHASVVRILDAQRKWIKQEDAAYITAHCLRIRDHEAAYRVHRWMSQQDGFHPDFKLATDLADCLGRNRRLAKCREVFDGMVKAGRVPAESTFHILITAYICEACVEEACSVYNKMIQWAGYRPRLSFHNALFRSLFGGPARRAPKPGHLQLAKLIYHNLVTLDLEVRREVYIGLIWLHSLQETVDRERIDALRAEMEGAGMKEGGDMLISILRACSKLGDVDEAERTWRKLLESERVLPSQAFVYLMELYSKVGNAKKSLAIFSNDMKKNRAGPVSAVAYLKIIEVMTKAGEVDVAEALVNEFAQSGLKPLNPAFRDLMRLYLRLGMHGKLEATFRKFLAAARCHPDRSMYTLYLESLTSVNSLEKAEEIFNEMRTNGAIGCSARSSNAILRGYLAANDYENGAKIYEAMRRKRYNVEPCSMKLMEQFFLDHHRKPVASVNSKLDQEQREILMGLLLAGGAEIIAMEKNERKHAITFEFDARSDVHSALRMHIHERFYEWLAPPYIESIDEDDDDNRELPFRFSTIAHSCFTFFSEQFRFEGRPKIPRLIHRWLSERVVAYWCMYGSFKTCSEDILLRLRSGKDEDIDRIVKKFQGKGMNNCTAKRKGRFIWMRFRGSSDAAQFWALVHPFLLQNVKELLLPPQMLLL